MRSGSLRRLALLVVGLTFVPVAARGRGDAESSPTLQQIAARIAQRWKVPILVEPVLAANTRAALPDDALPVAPALDATLAPLRRVTWRRLYLPPEQIRSLPSVESLSAAARSLEKRGRGSLLIEDPETGQVTALLRDEHRDPPSEDWRRLAKLDARPVYLVYRTIAPAEEASPESRFADLQQQQLALPLRPEHQALAFVQMMHLLQELEPAAREEFARRTLDAGLLLWDSTPPSQRQEMIQQTMELMKQFGAPPKRESAATERDQPRPRRSAPRAGGDARSLAAALADRYLARFLIDPGLLLTPPPRLPDPELPAGKALAAIAASLPGTAGRRLFLPDDQLKRLPSAEKLATAARELASLAPGTLLLENPATGRLTLYLKDQPAASSLPRFMEQGRFKDQPLYLLYNTTPSTRGMTLEERVADLQRQQIGLMLRMSPEQMAHSMQQVIRSFPSAGADARARLMGLPSMAGLMATWMPREAKERGQPQGRANR